jgi:hypothetical protein
MEFSFLNKGERGSASAGQEDKQVWARALKAMPEKSQVKKTSTIKTRWFYYDFFGVLSSIPGTTTFSEK